MTPPTSPLGSVAGAPLVGPAEGVGTSVFTRAFPAMGSACSVSVLTTSKDQERLTQHAVDRAWVLEQRWSRFIASSELSRLNAAGRGVVSHDTLLLVDRMISAWQWTNGLFDPTVLPQLLAAGYDRTFTDLPQNAADRLSDEIGVHISPDRLAQPAARRAPGCGSVQLDLLRREVELPPGCMLDPGGIGKGLAADLIAEELLEAGAAGVCVSMGGDIRCCGAFPGDGWLVGVADPSDASRVIATVALRNHGLATSNVAARTWQQGPQRRSHLIHPTGALPSPSATKAVVAASVLAGQAWWAEALTKVAILGGSVAETTVAGLGGELLAVYGDNTVTFTGGWGLESQVPAGVAGD